MAEENIPEKRSRDNASEAPAKRPAKKINRDLGSRPTSEEFLNIIQNIPDQLIKESIISSDDDIDFHRPSVELFSNKLNIIDSSENDTNNITDSNKVHLHLNQELAVNETNEQTEIDDTPPALERSIITKVTNDLELISLNVNNESQVEDLTMREIAEVPLRKRHKLEALLLAKREFIENNTAIEEDEENLKKNEISELTEKPIDSMDLTVSSGLKYLRNIGIALGSKKGKMDNFSAQLTTDIMFINMNRRFHGTKSHPAKALKKRLKAHSAMQRKMF